MTDFLIVSESTITLSAALTLDFLTLIPAGQTLHRRNYVAFHILLCAFPRIFLSIRGPLKAELRIKPCAEAALLCCQLICSKKN